MSRREKAPKVRRARRTFSAEAKADAVRLVRSGMSVGQVAREHDLTETALREWVKQAEADDGTRRDLLATEEREELARLRRENRQLKQERDILKAAATFFAKENA